RLQGRAVAEVPPALGAGGGAVLEGDLEPFVGDAEVGHRLGGPDDLVHQRRQVHQTGAGDQAGHAGDGRLDPAAQPAPPALTASLARPGSSSWTGGGVEGGKIRHPAGRGQGRAASPRGNGKTGERGRNGFRPQSQMECGRVLGYGGRGGKDFPVFSRFVSPRGRRFRLVEWTGRTAGWRRGTSPPRQRSTRGP